MLGVPIRSVFTTSMLHIEVIGLNVFVLSYGWRDVETFETCLPNVKQYIKKQENLRNTEKKY